MIRTERLDLVPATPPLVLAALEGAVQLGAGLGATMPDTWPPMYFDNAALEFTLSRLRENPAQADWWLHFVLLREAGGGRAAIGTAGFAGPPSPEGVVEVGYSIVGEQQRRGYATEAVQGMLTRAFGLAGIDRVVAETLPELEPSIGVLRKCGFRPAGGGSGPGIIRFELARQTFESRG